MVGEASLMNGESLEALGCIGRLGLKVIVALNDNGRGGDRHEALFGAFGMRCIGPVDGHDAVAVAAALEEAKAADCAVAVHVVTKKGKGFAPAEEDPEAWHSAAPSLRRLGTAALPVAAEALAVAAAWAVFAGDFAGTLAAAFAGALAALFGAAAFFAGTAFAGTFAAVFFTPEFLETLLAGAFAAAFDF